MFWKWIVCDVPHRSKRVFATAQEEWRAIRCATGLHGQCGGWYPGGRVDKACILGAWADPGSYERFMGFLHDAVTDESDQTDTYTAATVRTYTQLLRLRGEAPDFPSALERASFLRVAECQVAPSRRNHFLFQQMQLWEPAMYAAPGMLGGGFAVRVDDPLCFLVVSLWSEPAKHDRYALETVPELRKRADVEDDVEELTGYHLLLEPAWKVVPGQG